MTCQARRALGTVALVVAATAFLTSCGEETQAPRTSPTSATTAPVATNTNASPTPVVPSHPVTFPPTGAPSGPTPAPTSPTPIVPSHPVTFPPPQASATPITLRGTMSEGTRPSCHILQAGGKRYSLTGHSVAGLHVGDRVTVVGATNPHLMTSCGGIAFVVTRSQVHS